VAMLRAECVKLPLTSAMVLRPFSAVKKEGRVDFFSRFFFLPSLLCAPILLQLSIRQAQT